MQEQICRNCEYSQPTQFSLYSEKLTWYCSRQYSKRTYNGKLKIKPKQEACHMYKECTDNYKDIIIKFSVFIPNYTLPHKAPPKYKPLRPISRLAKGKK